MAITVPDGSVKDLRNVIRKAVVNDELPSDAMGWVAPAGASAAPSSEPAKAKGKGKKAVEPEPEDDEEEAPPPVPAPTGGSKADQKRAQSAWDTMASRTFNANDYAPAVGLAEPKSANFQTYKAGQKQKSPQKGQAPGGFDPTFADTNYGVGGGQRDVPDWAQDPNAGQQDKKKGLLGRMFGQKKADEPEPTSIQPKQGALSRIFTKKGGPKVKGKADDQGTFSVPGSAQQQPVSFEPDVDSIGKKPQPPAESPEWQPGQDMPGKMSGQGAQAQLWNDLGGRPGVTSVQPWKNYVPPSKPATGTSEPSMKGVKSKTPLSSFAPPPKQFEPVEKMPAAPPTGKSANPPWLRGPQQQQPVDFYSNQTDPKAEPEWHELGQSDDGQPVFQQVDKAPAKRPAKKATSKKPGKTGDKK